MDKTCCWCDEPATMTLITVARVGSQWQDTRDPACDDHVQKYQYEYDRIEEPQLKEANTTQQCAEHEGEKTPCDTHAWTWKYDDGPQQVCDNCGEERLSTSNG